MPPEDEPTKAIEELLGFERPTISSAVEEAYRRFKHEVHIEKELSSESIMIGHMSDFAISRVFEMVMNREPEEEIVQYLERALQSFRRYRRDPHPTSNPIRVWRRGDSPNTNRKP